MSTQKSKSKETSSTDSKQVFGPNGFGTIIDYDVRTNHAFVKPIRDKPVQAHDVRQLEIVDDEERVYYPNNEVEVPHR